MPCRWVKSEEREKNVKGERERESVSERERGRGLVHACVARGLL